MSDPRPPAPNDRLGMAERGVHLVQAITLRNVMVLGLLILIAIPSFFAYKFFTDKEFRQEWNSYVQLKEEGVPCLVYELAEVGDNARTIVATAYDVEPKFEHLIGMRSSSVASKELIEQMCTAAHADVDTIRVIYRKEKQ